MGLLNMYDVKMVCGRIKTIRHQDFTKKTDYKGVKNHTYVLCYIPSHN